MSFVKRPDFVDNILSLRPRRSAAARNDGPGSLEMWAETISPNFGLV